MQDRITKLSVAGAICYAVWGCLHTYAGYNLFLLGDTVDPGMVRGRLHQGGWNLFFFGVTAIGVALTLNIRNSKWGYWINLGVLALADTGLIFFCPDPRLLDLVAWPRRTDSVGCRLYPDHASLCSRCPRRGSVAAMKPDCERIK
jgi:hypothetical protein